MADHGRLQGRQREKLDPSAIPTEDASLHIWVRDVRRTRYLHVVPAAPFGRVWPPPEEEGWDHARFEADRTPAELRALSSPGRSTRTADDLVVLAAEEGFLSAEPDLSTPEAALTSMYAAWVELDVQKHRGWEAFKSKYLGEGVSFADLTPAERSAMSVHEGRPYQDTRHLRRLAEDALARWPDHPIADHALLALLRTEVIVDEPEAVDADVVADLVEAIRDPRIREQAALLATRLPPPARMSARLIDAISSVPATSPANDLALSTWATSRAVALEDWRRAHALSARVRGLLDEECSADEPHPSVPCEMRSYDLRDTASRLVALGYGQPQSWQEALTAAAWRCHLTVERHRGISRTTATWTGTRWSFAPWDRPTGATDCLDDVETTEGVPDRPTAVRLTLEGPGAAPQAGDSRGERAR